MKHLTPFVWSFVPAACLLVQGCAGPAGEPPVGVAQQRLESDGGVDPTAWADDRVQAMVSQMTYAQKIAQLQNDAPAIPSIALAAYHYWNEGLHGVLADGVTVFPQAIGLGSTWDPDLLLRVAAAVSDEARGLHAKSGKGLTYWSPVINMLRDPRWGRYEESYGEDPYLVGRMGVAFVRGMQGDDPKYLKTVATPKHYAANNAEYNRHSGSSDMDERNLREYYLPAFHATVVESQAFSVMAAYNSINGVPGPANTLLLHDILRAEWGFRGFVVSDCDAVADIVNAHHWTATLAQAAGKALQAGTDLNCGTTYPAELQASLDQGLVTERNVDVALARVLRARFLLGEFDDAAAVPYASITPAVIESQAHAALALEAGHEAVVLLKNANAILPLDKSKLRSVAVIGPLADGWILGSYAGMPSQGIASLDGIKAKFWGTATNVSFSPGGTVTGPKDQAAIDAAASAARSADVAIVFVGTNQDVMGEGKDRPDWKLPGAQEDLVEAVFAANPKTVAVLVTGAPLAVDWAKANVPAIVAAFYNGQAQGTAIADVLFGDYNPGGRLTGTWYTGDTQLPPIGDYDVRKGRTYLYYTGTPLYPFGHGLSYTTFTYGNLGIDPSTIEPGGAATVRVDVTNTGTRAGDEVVQLYTHAVDASMPRPIKELRGFARVHLGPSEKKTVALTIAAKDLAFWDATGHAWRVDAGAYEILVGASSADIRAEGKLTVGSGSDAAAEATSDGPSGEALPGREAGRADARSLEGGAPGPMPDEPDSATEFPAKSGCGCRVGDAHGAQVASVFGVFLLAVGLRRPLRRRYSLGVAPACCPKSRWK